MYETTEDYIRGEYGEELPIVRAILERSKPRFLGAGGSREERDAVLDRLTMEIVGYYTGCLGPDGRDLLRRERP